MENKTVNKKISLNDWQNVLYKMNFYNKDSGFVDYDLFGNLTFFDSDPYIDNIHAFPINKQQVLEYMGTRRTRKR